MFNFTSFYKCLIVKWMKMVWYNGVLQYDNTKNIIEYYIFHKRFCRQSVQIRVSSHYVNVQVVGICIWNEAGITKCEKKRKIIFVFYLFIYFPKKNQKKNIRNNTTDVDFVKGPLTQNHIKCCSEVFLWDHKLYASFFVAPALI